MKKVNVALIAGLLAVAAVLGTVAATHSVSLGASHRRSTDKAVQVRAKQLDAFEASLRRALAKKTPALPRVPKAPAVTRSAAAPVQPRVVYRRPPAIVVVRHTHHGDDGYERSDGGGGGDD